ncbi:MAG TPA: hypothetical protein VNZ67_03865, partial [bacterium]|nr:hypothetical protein [bacterium]
KVQNNITFSSSASGSDGNVGSPITTGLQPSNVVQIQDQGGLAIQQVSWTPFLAQASVGQLMTLVVTVTNPGLAIDNNVVASATPFGSGAATLVGSPGPASIAANANSAFTFTYSASSNGTVAFSVNASGTSNSNPITAAQLQTSTAVAIQGPAALALSLSTLPVPVSQGQLVTVVATINNSGAGATANGVTLSAVPSVLPAGLLTFSTSAGVSAGNLAAGAFETFTYYYLANLTGTASIAATAVGTDANSSQAVASSVANSSEQVLSPVNLSVTVAVNPASALPGGAFTVQVTVKNLGQANAVGVSLTPMNFDATSLTGLNPNGLAVLGTILGGGSVVQNYTINAQNPPGAAWVDVTATGQDANSGLIFFAHGFNNSFNVVGANPILTAAWTLTQPAQVSVGQPVQEIFAVTDTNALVNAQNVTATAVGANGNTGPPTVTGPAPAIVANLAGGTTTFFTYSYVFPVSGTAYLTGSASALSASAAVNLSGVTITVQTPPNLSVSAGTIVPANVSVGESFTVLFTVSNLGQATALNVVPSTPTRTGNANGSVLGAASPAGATLGSGAGQTFTYVGTAGAGSSGTQWTLGYFAGAQGLDSNSGLAVNAASVQFAPPINVFSPAQLSGSLTITPAVVDINDPFTVLMQVNNTGADSANNVLPNPLVISGPGGANLSSGPVSAPSIASGGSHTFTWIYNALGTGAVNLQATASGQDQYSNFTVSSAPASSSLLIQSPAHLTSSMAAIPTVVGTGNPLTVVLTVFNTGNSSAVNVHAPASPVVAGSAGAVLLASTVTAGANYTIPGNQSQAFTWTFSTPASGVVTFSDTALGADALDAAALSTQS